MDVSVWPFFTVIFVAVRIEETAGRKICEPALISFASRIAGFTESSSCQRTPLPRFCSAIFQSESPGRAITALSFAAPLGATGRIGVAGATGAEGRESGRVGGATKTRGSSNGDRLTGG